MSLELSFEKRYIIIYTLILATTHHIISNINSMYENIFNIKWPIEVIVLVMVLIFISIFDRNQKLRIALGIFFKKTPFEKANQYLKKDNRIKNKSKIEMDLKNISNSDFFNKYYDKVKKENVIIAKNSEYCIIRDIAFVIFVIMIVMLILTIIWCSQFYKELIASMIAYIMAVISCRRKSKDFVLQIIVEYLSKEDES